MKIIYGFTFVILFCSITSCKKFDSLLDNPNSVSPSLANVDLLLNNAQISFNSVYTSLSDYGAQVVRQQQFFGPLYTNAYQPANFDAVWTNAYTGVIKSVDVLAPIANGQKKYIHLGIAQVLKAYTLGSLVDYFGDIPASQSSLGEVNLTPKADKGDVVYKQVIELLDSAVSNFAKTSGAKPTNDLFFNGDAEKWTKTAKTLKLKFLLQTRLVDNTISGKVADLLDENDLINTSDDDFQFRYSTNLSAPNSRHPHYNANYNNASSGSNDVSDYIANYFMWSLFIEKTGSPSSLDPRRRFYFYRQRITSAAVNEETCPCIVENRPAHYPSDMPFCLVNDGVGGYWGRDHGDNDGTPPDGSYRTTWGVYPAGGEFDASQGESVDYNKGAKGAGIDPIWVSAFTYFMQAEAAQTLNITTNGTARFLLEKAVRESISKVVGFPSFVGVSIPSNFTPSATAIDNYVDFVLDQYDDASGTQEKLGVIMKEYHIATWGNGIEPYNNYRRTGFPDNLQPIKSNPNPGFFIRSFLYPSVYVNRNINAAPQKSPGLQANKVFWDTNPDNFIK